MTVGHRERPESAESRELAPLLRAERVARELVQRQRELLVRDDHVLHDQELAETCAEPQERLLVRRLHDVLPCGEAVQVRLQGRVLEVVHDGALDLHRAVLSSPARWRSSAPSDRKSTRLNSSHDQISYAVFCLKKKKPCYTIIVADSSCLWSHHRAVCLN